MKQNQESSIMEEEEESCDRYHGRNTMRQDPFIKKSWSFLRQPVHLNGLPGNFQRIPESFQRVHKSLFEVSRRSFT